MFPLILRVLTRDYRTPDYNPHSGLRRSIQNLTDQISGLGFRAWGGCRHIGLVGVAS